MIQLEVEANVLGCDMVVSRFEHQLRYYVHFQTETQINSWPSIFPQLWLNSTTICTSSRMVLALNNPWRLICHWTKKQKPNEIINRQIYGTDPWHTGKISCRVAKSESLKGISLKNDGNNCTILPSQLGLWNTLTAPLERGKTPPPNECPEYDTKQSDGEVPAVLEFWGMRSTPSLPSLLGPLWPEVVAPDRALSMG